MSISYGCALDRKTDLLHSKNPMLNVASERIKRRHGQFDRALHRFYSEPRTLSTAPIVNRLLNRLYWGFRALQFKVFYKDEELDDEDLSEMKWEVAVHPPPIEELQAQTGFNRKWLKYMYAKFKNECPTGRMKEAEFKRLLACIIAPERASDQYLGRLFKAFASGTDNSTITFQSLLECLSSLSPQTSEANARWTIRIINSTGDGTRFNFADFLQFTQSIFALQEGKGTDHVENRETVHQRATVIFQELDQDHDGVVKLQDMARFFQFSSNSDEPAAMTGFRLGTTSKKEKLSPPATKPTALVDAVTGPPQGFGIKSYLHNFYHSPTVEDIEQSGAWYLLPPPPSQRRGLFVCRICTVLGLLLLIGGAVSIIVGYTWPHESIEDSIYNIAVYRDDEGNLYIPREKMQEMLRDPMRHWKTAGFCLFASGAAILALSLIVPIFAQCIGSKRLQGFISEDNSPNEPPIRIFPGQSSPGQTTVTASGPVPVMEEIAKVQPGAEKERAASQTDDLLTESDESRLIH